MVPPKEPSALSRPRRAAVPPSGALAGCPFHDIRVKLSAAGLRPTRQRLALGWLLFAKGARHVTAENLQDEALASRVSISLATIYNSLHQFTQAGLLREIAIDGSRTYFDTNVTDHHHFLVEGTNTLIDIPRIAVDRHEMPPLPPGKTIAGVDVIVRLRDT
ncbi:MAG: transcriptional repressor [Beijerinckiaceae bacterium]|nr:transcriptional repressor [Beijerinckiaceae bacterium]